MASNRMTVKNAAQLAAEEAATYGSSYGLLRALSAYAPDFLKTGYGQAYYGPVMPAIDATINVIARATGSAVRGTFSAADAAVNFGLGVVSAYTVQAVSNASGLDVSEIDPALRTLVEATATAATSRALRFAGEKAATLSIFNRNKVNNANVYANLLNANGAAASDAPTGTDLEAQQQQPAHTSPRPGQTG
jgi:hypothetical protein